jgi:hypothetical protein
LLLLLENQASAFGQPKRRPLTPGNDRTSEKPFRLSSPIHASV